jgi:3-oxoacid CoA-transferase subunit A
MKKVFGSAAEAVADIPSGASICVGGFGLCGVPIVLIDALAEADADQLHIVSNNCGTDGFGLGVLLEQHRIARVTASYVGENAEFARQYLAGEVEVELTPQGSLAERMRAGGCGIPAFYTLAGVGTLVGDGGLPWRYASDGSVARSSPKKEARRFNDREYILEEAITTDYALVRAAIADHAGNLVFNEAARNFNPLCAMAGRTTIVEAEEIVEAGALSPDQIHLPGVFVQRICPVPVGTEKRIERRTVRPRVEAR